MKKRVERGIYIGASGTYHVVYKNERGEMVWKTTGQKSLKAARQILEKHKTDVALNINLPNRKFESVKFVELFDNWWERDGSRKSKDWKYLTPAIRAHFEKFKARQVTSDMVQDFLEGLEETGLGASSLNHRRTILNCAFNFAIKRKEYDENPVRAVPQFREPPGRQRFPVVDEVRAIFDVLAEDPEVLAAIIVLSTTTLRKGEILKRPWAEIFLDGLVPYVYVPKSKNGDEKKVPLPAVAARLLAALPSRGNSEYVFPSRPTTRFRRPGKPYRWDIGKEWRAACKTAGVEGLRIHDLRHMGASILTELGTAPEIIRKITGHRGKQLDRYQHLSELLKKNTVDLIEHRIFGPADKETVH